MIAKLAATCTRQQASRLARYVLGAQPNDYVGKEVPDLSAHGEQKDDGDDGYKDQNQGVLDHALS
jgi:hypothetical protein